MLIKESTNVLQSQTLGLTLASHLSKSEYQIHRLGVSSFIGYVIPASSHTTASKKRTTSEHAKHVRNKKPKLEFNLTLLRNLEMTERLSPSMMRVVKPAVTTYLIPKRHASASAKSTSWKPGSCL